MEVVEPWRGRLGVIIAIEAERALLEALGAGIVGAPVRTEGVSVEGTGTES